MECGMIRAMQSNFPKLIFSLIILSAALFTGGVNRISESPVRKQEHVLALQHAAAGPVLTDLEFYKILE